MVWVKARGQDGGTASAWACFLKLTSHQMRGKKLVLTQVPCKILPFLLRKQGDGTEGQLSEFGLKSCVFQPCSCQTALGAFLAQKLRNFIRRIWKSPPFLVRKSSWEKKNCIIKAANREVTESPPQPSLQRQILRSHEIFAVATPQNEHKVKSQSC